MGVSAYGTIQEYLYLKTEGNKYNPDTVITFIYTGNDGLDNIGISPSGKPIDQNDLLIIRDNYHKFIDENWDGLELEEVDNDRADFLREIPGERGLWLEPEVNRTSLLYDRLSFVLNNPDLSDRFSYTFKLPYQILFINQTVICNTFKFTFTMLTL